MTTKDTKPVIFLAFANDRGGNIGYLRNLPEEARQVQAALAAAPQAGLCEVVVHQNVTVETVCDVFQDAHDHTCTTRRRAMLLERSASNLRTWTIAVPRLHASRYRSCLKPDR